MNAATEAVETSTAIDCRAARRDGQRTSGQVSTSLRKTLVASLTPLRSAYCHYRLNSDLLVRRRRRALMSAQRQIFRLGSNTANMFSLLLNS